MPRPPESDKVRFHRPPNLFKQKVGEGGIPPERLLKAQTFIEGTKVDFQPYAAEYLRAIENAIAAYESGVLTARETIDRMTLPVMQLKANGGMFRYELLSDIADTLLYFMEKIERLNADSLSVIRVHVSALHSITKNGLGGSGGREGRALLDELERACDRYTRRHGTE